MTFHQFLRNHVTPNSEFRDNCKLIKLFPNQETHQITDITHLTVPRMYKHQHGDITCVKVRKLKFYLHS